MYSEIQSFTSQLDSLATGLMDNPEKLSRYLERIRVLKEIKVKDVQAESGVCRSSLYKHLSTTNDGMPLKAFVGILRALGYRVVVVPDSDGRALRGT